MVGLARSAQGCLRLIVALGLSAGMAAQPAAAAGKAKKSGDDGPVCHAAKPGDHDDDDDKDSDGITADLGGMCVGVSGDVQATGQSGNVNEPRIGGGGNSSRGLTIKPDLRLESALETQFGKLKTAFEIDWSYASKTGFEQVPNLDEANVSYLGVTIGYAESLMNFWDSSDFQFSATAPNRSDYLASYERALTDDLTATIAVESGPATSRGEDTWQLPSTPPYYTGRLRYEKNGWTLHGSGAFHELRMRAPPLFTGPLEWKQGWAVSAGVTVPFQFVHEDDSATVQATYATNASIFLGTQSDIAFLAAVVPTTGPAKGWSVVGSYTHNWSEKWKSAAFVSQLELAVDVQQAHPSLSTTRAGANLTYDIDDQWQLGAELDYLSARFNLDGTFGIINGANLSGMTGYAWVKWQF